MSRFPAFILTLALYILNYTLLVSADCDRAKAEAQTKCPDDWQQNIKAVTQAAKDLVQEAVDKLKPEQVDETSQKWYTLWMGHACEKKNVIEVLQGVIDWDYGVYCGTDPGHLFSSYCSIVIPPSWNDDQNPSNYKTCHGPISNVPYGFVHEISHSQHFISPNGTTHWVDDGNHEPIQSVHAPVCYNPSCLMPNAEKDDECFNGFNASAYAYLVWALHCNNGTETTAAGGSPTEVQAPKYSVER